NLLIGKDGNNILKTLSEICHIEISEQDTSGIFLDLIGSKPQLDNNETIVLEKKKSVKKVIDTHGSIDKELELIKNAFKSNSHIELITPGYKTAEWMSHFLREHQIDNIISIKTEKWCSVEYLRELLSSNTRFERKKLILITKLSFWLLHTKTGLLDELKYYGDERIMLVLFFCRENEWNIWRESYNKKIQQTPLLISEIGNQSNSDRFTMIKDIPLIEDVVRRKESAELDFDMLIASIHIIYSDNLGQEGIIHMLDMIGIIRSIYESIPERPTGPLAYPPGNHGETYFITQEMLWHRGHKWLVHSSRTLEMSWKNWKDTHSNIEGRETILAIEYIEKCIYQFAMYHNRGDDNRNIILTIMNEKTKITFIPRSIEKYITSLLNSSISYGSNISLPQTRAFIMREYGYVEDDFVSNEVFHAEHNIKYMEYHPSTIVAGSIILTTSQKNARDIGQVLRKIHGKNIDILIQGLSGGKGKMLSTFKKNIHKTILIGIIDTWRDEYSLWTNAECIYITKIPFDPPTDPYFLARTVGMQNNFSEYSEPIVTIRLNTLFERISSSGYSKSIFITDTRLSDTEWGKRIQKELL
ncbi:hypothetical protein K2X92_02145, partial [Candidatus Gracilibacteria bacterium]|nr:hypothetical protein [Candidatus Gracilibacteria bacterium]